MVSGSVAVAETVFPAAKSFSTSRSGAGTLGSFSCARARAPDETTTVIAASAMYLKRKGRGRLTSRTPKEIERRDSCFTFGYLSPAGKPPDNVFAGECRMRDSWWIATSSDGAPYEDSLHAGSCVEWSTVTCDAYSR